MNLKKRLFFSAVFAVLFAIIAYYIMRLVLPEDALWISILSGGLAYFLMPFALYIDNKITNKKYSPFEIKIGDTCFLKSDGYLVTTQKGRYCKIYFCDFGIAFASFDKKPHIVHVIKTENILKYQTNMKFLYIYTKNEEVFCFKVSNINLIIETLKDKHWIE